MASILVNPYVIREVGTKVSLTPPQADFNLYKNLKNNLMQKLEGKNIKIGNVVKIHKITDYRKGDLPRENFSGNSIYDIKYVATLCIPIELKQIIVRLDMKGETEKAINIKVLKALKAVNGCIDCIVMTNLIDFQKFQINTDGTVTYKPTGNPLMQGDYLKVTIQSKQINANMNRILVLGFLNDIASNEEVKDFYDTPSLETLQEQTEHDIQEPEIEVFES